LLARQNVTAAEQEGLSEMPVKLDCFGASAAGSPQSRIQDEFLIADFVKSLHIHFSSLSLDDRETLTGATLGQVLLVSSRQSQADNEQRFGQLAISATAQTLLEALPSLFGPNHRPCPDFSTDVESVLDRCQAALPQRLADESHSNDQPCMLTMAWIVWPNLHLLHVGDNRACLHRRGVLHVLATDERAGSTAAVWSHPLWSCLGLDVGRNSPQLHHEALQVGDTLLLCTSGLSHAISDGELRAHLGREGRAAELCRDLLALACDRGAADGATAVVARIHDARESLKMIADQLPEEEELSVPRAKVTAASLDEPFATIPAGSVTELDPSAV
jgi:serine/threonine protein phosphatase PrpC